MQHLAGPCLSEHGHLRESEAAPSAGAGAADDHNVPHVAGLEVGDVDVGTDVPKRAAGHDGRGAHHVHEGRQAPTVQRAVRIGVARLHCQDELHKSFSCLYQAQGASPKGVELVAYSVGLLPRRIIPTLHEIQERRGVPRH